MPIIAKKFKTLVKGTIYELPRYRVTDNGLVELKTTQTVTFVRGSRGPEDNIDRHDGVLHEGLLAMQIEDLKYKNQLVPDLSTEAIIAHLEACLDLFAERARRRLQQSIQGTYKKSE